MLFLRPPLVIATIPASVLEPATDIVVTAWSGLVSNPRGSQYEVLTPVFSTGIKMVKIKEQTVTSGTAPVIKAVWANQAASSKETQLHGWAMNY